MNQAADSVGTSARPLLLAGSAVEGVEQVPVLFPYDGREVGSVWLAGDDQVEAALAGAEAAEAEVAALPPFRRAEILIAAAGLVLEREGSLAEQMTLETGNAVWETGLEVRPEPASRHVLRRPAASRRRVHPARVEAARSAARRRGAERLRPRTVAGLARFPPR